MNQIERSNFVNQVNNGLRMIMYSDKVDIEQHIQFNNSAMEKLKAMTENHASDITGQADAQVLQQKSIKAMDDQI